MGGVTKKAVYQIWHTSSALSSIFGVGWYQRALKYSYVSFDLDCGLGGKINLWTNNWLGSRLVDLLNVPSSLH